ncbi:MAG: (d)CMP kinase [Clostridiales bacterium]|nr:(d)CMP kinase [Clostridiales bacterium]MBE5746679.1 (d)CMP kinase [Clostridiales bacterium]
MTIIRGATTVAQDNKEEISFAVKELLDEVFALNDLQKDEVKGFVFSLTTDIHSYHPAKAARECGYDFAPLFAAIEPEINGGLKLCIRLMLLTELSDDRKAKHVYQKGAKNLRKDISEILNIALDGPAGSGKSTVAKILAKDYNILYLDTGAMYRACGLKALRLGIDTKDCEKVTEMLPLLDVKVEYKDGKQHTILDGEDVSLAIRENAVSMAASNVSAHPAVRIKMVEMQREIAGNMSCVLDGRDIGSTVLPNAKYKFFITADSKVRAMRRFKELQARGETVDFDKLHEEIKARDKQDSEREFSPLKCADDAVVVDTSTMDIDEVISTIKKHIQSKI